MLKRSSRPMIKTMKATKAQNSIIMAVKICLTNSLAYASHPGLDSCFRYDCTISFKSSQYVIAILNDLYRTCCACTERTETKICKHEKIAIMKGSSIKSHKSETETNFEAREIEGEKREAGEAIEWKNSTSHLSTISGVSFASLDRKAGYRASSSYQNQYKSNSSAV